MRIDWRTDKNAPNGKVIDLDTGEFISGPQGYCCMVDEEKGEWARYKYVNHTPVIGKDGRMEVEYGKGRVKFVEFPKYPSLPEKPAESTGITITIQE